MSDRVKYIEDNKEVSKEEFKKHWDVMWKELQKEEEEFSEIHNKFLEKIRCMSEEERLKMDHDIVDQRARLRKSSFFKYSTQSR